MARLPAQTTQLCIPFLHSWPCSTDPRRDKVEDLKRVAGACGHPGLVALTGDADGVRMERAASDGVRAPVQGLIE